MRYPRRLPRTMLALSLILPLFGGDNRARAQAAFERSAATQLFEPAVGTRDTLLTLEGATVAHHLGFALGLMVNYQTNPLVLYIKSSPSATGGFDLDDADRRVAVVENQLTSDLYGVVGFRFGWLQGHAGLSLPVNLLLRGNEVGVEGQELGSFEGEGIGDVRLHLKALLFSDLAGFSLAFAPVLSIPTACLSSGGLSDCASEGNLAGEPNVSFKPRLAAHYRYRNLLVVANLGGVFRESTRVFSSELSHRLLYGVGAGYQVHRRVFTFSELVGQAGFGTKSGCSADASGKTVCTGTSSSDLDAFPLEVDFGAHVSLPKGFQLTGGFGFGLIKAVGSPELRLIAGLRWAPDWRDADGDGVPDPEDDCPTQAEDRDGFRDGDGCPETDNDNDLIPDPHDKCPDRAEDQDQFEDQDGCPEPDNDRDGLADLVDHCPNEPETKNNFKDQDGCPDEPDQDEDGIRDDQDRCPSQAEDADGFEDGDGCPDPDNDGDGIPDGFDDCPGEAEDPDGFQDDDGCPDPDNDGDGVSDAKDRCPGEKETINGYRDSDGCPDKGKPNVTIEENKIVIGKKVFFLTNKARIRAVSHGILDEVALTILANPQIKLVRVEGHTDNKGSASRNKTLSQERAEAVRDYLVGRGVDSARLEPVGHGAEQPIADNRTEDGRSKNRRVEFTIR